jgi:hypothetical protein
MNLVMSRKKKKNTGCAPRLQILDIGPLPTVPEINQPVCSWSWNTFARHIIEHPNFVIRLANPAWVNALQRQCVRMRIPHKRRLVRQTKDSPPCWIIYNELAETQLMEFEWWWRVQGVRKTVSQWLFEGKEIPLSATVAHDRTLDFHVGVAHLLRTNRRAPYTLFRNKHGRNAPILTRRTGNDGTQVFLKLHPELLPS